MNYLVSLQDVSVTFAAQKHPVLKNINLIIKKGDRLLITGCSGTGKSTLLYILAEIIPKIIYAKVEGLILRDNFSTGIVMQNPMSQMVTPSVEEEIAFSMENRSMPLEEIKEKTDNAIRKAGITGLKHKKPFELSGGEMQKVALTAAVASEPDLLLLDEPTSFLDNESTYNFLKTLGNVSDKTAVIIVEHRIKKFLKYIDKILYLDDHGEIYLYEDKYAFLKNADNSHKLKPRFISGNNPGFMPFDKPIKRGNSCDSFISVKGLSFSYNRKEEKVLKNINVEMYRGETIAVMGPNGSGKTTFIENIAGFYKKTKKNISFNGKTLDKLKKREFYSSLHYLPQNPEYFFLYQSVGEELKDVMRITSTGYKPLFNFYETPNRSPYNLSEGEKRRLTLELVLCDKRPVLLADEPTYGLDFDAYYKTAEAFNRLKEEGTLIVIVTHDPEFAFFLSDRILFFKDGSIIFNGSPGRYIEYIESNKDLFPGELYLPAGLNERIL
ncbi:MAG: ATP-binding cassette domain-containing protein [Spirochaetes bacterium]|nr:ATP-binding cassette domain-containing protein [Spirochaetota bacterium]